MAKDKNNKEGGLGQRAWRGVNTPSQLIQEMMSGPKHKDLTQINPGNLDFLFFISLDCKMYFIIDVFLIYLSVSGTLLRQGHGGTGGYPGNTRQGAGIRPG